MKIGALIYTYNRVDDARINMEIMRNYWQKLPFFSDLKIVHSFNGDSAWFSDKYLEDELVLSQNSTHFAGASALIDAGVEVFQESYPDTDYIVVVAADTWLVDPDYLAGVVEQMHEGNKLLATCPWGLAELNRWKEVGMAVDFFVVNLKWATKYKMFPINYNEFYDKFSDLFFYQGSNIGLEKLAMSKFVKACFADFQVNNTLRQMAYSKIYELLDREPVHEKINEDESWSRFHYWGKMGLITHHFPEPKKELLQKLGVTEGENIQRLLEANDLSYFNNGVR